MRSITIPITIEVRQRQLPTKQIKEVLINSAMEGSPEDLPIIERLRSANLIALCYTLATLYTQMPASPQRIHEMVRHCQIEGLQMKHKADQLSGLDAKLAEIISKAAQ